MLPPSNSCSHLNLASGELRRDFSVPVGTPALTVWHLTLLSDCAIPVHSARVDGILRAIALPVAFFVKMDLLSPSSSPRRSMDSSPSHSQIYLLKRPAIFATPFQMAPVRLNVVQAYGNLTLPNSDCRQTPLLIVHTLDST